MITSGILIIPAEVYFKKEFKREDGLLISKIKYFKPILVNCRLDIMIFILY